MWLPLIPILLLLLVSAFAAMLAFVTAISAQAHFQQRGLWITYGVLLAVSLCPVLWHYQSTIHYAANYGVYGPETPIGTYPGLERFRIAVPAAALLLWILAWTASRRLPLIGALLPAAAFLGYMRTLGWVVENPPGVVLDNKTIIGLFMLSVAATAGLVTYTLAVWGRPFASREVQEAEPKR
jgi:hypothetical protein